MKFATKEIFLSTLILAGISPTTSSASESIYVILIGAQRGVLIYTTESHNADTLIHFGHPLIKISENHSISFRHDDQSLIDDDLVKRIHSTFGQEVSVHSVHIDEMALSTQDEIIEP